MDRAHRLGQKRTVNVYRLLTKDSLEDKIMGLQRFKLDVANSVVNQDNVSLKTMDAGRLLDLFTLDKDQKAAGTLPLTSSSPPPPPLPPPLALFPFPVLFCCLRLVSCTVCVAKPAEQACAVVKARYERHFLLCSLSPEGNLPVNVF